jgi:toxin ParE1/3/4
LHCPRKWQIYCAKLWKAAKLVISPRAAFDLEEIGDYIARNNPSRAVSFIRELERECRRIAKRPAAFPARGDLAPA